MKPKKKIYVALFTLLGVLCATLAHAVIEIIYINNFLLVDFGKYSFGLSWGELLAAHAVFTAVLLVAGVLAGFKQGIFWWQKIYVEKRLEPILKRIFKSS